MTDLRSDTVTKPTQAMRQAMFNAEVGDDVFKEDPTVNALEQKVAELFGKDDALFTASGVMANQIAIKAHTRPGDEVICDKQAHIYNFEGGGIAFNSGASVRLIDGDNGRFTAEQVQRNINDPSNVHFPLTRLVAAENTCNKGGGSLWDFEELKRIGALCKEYGLAYHLDGARLLNALAETNESAKDYGHLFDSVSICLSKGLGAPVGSILTGSKEFITKARRIRKVMGGAMRQAGYLAAAGIYALDNHTEQLKNDHKKARHLGAVLEEQPYVEEVLPVQSNIVIFRLSEKYTETTFLEKLAAHNIQAVPFGPQTIRFVTHLDFTDTMLESTVEVLKNL
ncbi:MAG: aminotransferase class I/II-fold pyridoxal phosphate-dependent enzyme [Bacteroidales bacterium]|nr:aminotransferase class I/II-fold pyridoxal phosphate-dependent enzyme [Bacteroidales bacterium]MCF8334365.1 aminotransferase class I/II-fold pyridoxal phosphate-dependent enzyme [Bacteroidales bacterium]